MSKWSFGNATLVTEVAIVHCYTLGFSTEIPDDAQINMEPR